MDHRQLAVGQSEDNAVDGLMAGIKGIIMLLEEMLVIVGVFLKDWTG